MAKTQTAKNGGSTFVTNDWRNLNASTNEPLWAAALAGGEEMANFEDVKNGSLDVGAAVGIGNVRLLAQDVALLKQENHQIKLVVYDLQKDRDNLRTAIRKLKVENTRIKGKLKRVCDAVKAHGGLDKMDIDNVDEEVDYEDLRQFLLVGGPKDPFALQFSDAAIQDTNDANRTEHKTSERYYWYKMAQTFDDKDAMQKILTAEDSRKAEEIVKEVKNFDQAKWDSVKVKIWEDAQRLKFEQHRWIRNLLVKTGSTYIAVASQDKVIGTGWRKQREEASRTQLWDGDNAGGKILMKLRDEFTESHSWTTPNEEQEALQKFNDFKRSIWKPYGSSSRGRGGGIGGARRGVERLAVSTASFPPPQQSTVAARLGPKPAAAAKKRRQI